MFLNSTSFFFSFLNALSGKKNTTAAPYNKHSDESETSSIDSYSLDTDKNALRGKKDRLSNRSNNSAVSRDSAGSGFSGGGISNTPTGPPLPYSLDRPIDTNQLMNDIQNSLASAHHPSSSSTYNNQLNINDANRSPGSGGHPGKHKRFCNFH